MKKSFNFFPGSNTCYGFKSLYPYLYQNCKQVFILKGGPGTGKSTFLKKLAKDIGQKNYLVEYHWCSSDPDSLDGLVFPELKIALLDGNAPHIIDPPYPGVQGHIINLGSFWDSQYLQTKNNLITKINSRVQEKFTDAYFHLRMAKETRDYLASHTQQSLLADYFSPTIRQIYQSFLSQPPQKKGDNRHLFGTAVTPQGSKSFLSSLTEECKSRLIFSGPANKEISKIISGIGESFALLGYQCLFLHCGFNSQELDGLILPNEGLAILDSNIHHPLEKKSKDIILSSEGFLSKKKLSCSHRVIRELEIQYENYLTKGITFLAEAKCLRSELEEIYIQAMDFSLLDREYERLVQLIKFSGQESI